MINFFTKKNLIIALAVTFAVNNYAQEEFVDETETMQITSYNTSNCIGGFNNAFGTSFKEGNNIVNGKPIFIGVGRAEVDVGTNGKNPSGSKGSWANALSDAYMKAELRGKAQIVSDRKTQIEQEIILENTTKNSDGDRPDNVNEAELSTWDKVKFVVKNKLSDVLELDALEFEMSQREAAVKDIIRQNSYQRILNTAAYSEMTGMQSIYTNYYSDNNAICTVVLKNTDSSIMAKALGGNRLNLLMPDKSKAGLPISEQLPQNPAKLLFTHGVRVLRDEKGAPVLVAFGMVSFKAGPEASIDAEIQAKRLARAAVASFIKEKIDVESKTTINAINTTYAGRAEDGSDLTDYFSEKSVEDRMRSTVSNSVSMGDWPINTEFTNGLSNERVYFVAGAISLETLQAVMTTTLEGLNRERI